MTNIKEAKKITVSNKLSILLFGIGLVLTLVSNLNNNYMVISGLALLILSIAMFALNVSNGLNSILLVVYASLLTLIFLSADNFKIFEPRYLVWTLLLLPISFCCIGLGFSKGDFKRRVISTSPYIVATVSVTYVHFLVVAILAASV